MYDPKEDYKIDCWQAAAYGARALANALPLAVLIAAFAFLIQSVLSQPFTLSCKSEPIQTATAPAALVIEPDAKASEVSDEKKTEVAPQAEPSVIYPRKEQY